MTEAAVSTRSTQAPDVIQHLLEKLGVPYQVIPECDSLPAQQRIQAVLLEDSIGALLVLFPQNLLLDLARLEELTGRKLLAVAPERLARMLSRHTLQRLPALPSLTSMPCLYDERLLHPEQVLIESGEPGLLLQIPRDAFRPLLSKASTGQFGQLLSGITPNLNHPAEDRAAISHAVQAFTARRIQQRLEETIEIPPLPETAQKIIKLRVDPNASVDDITGLVETDPALAAQVISWAASPYYAAPGKIRSVEDAIVRVLGFDLVINLALGLALGKSLSLPKDRPQHVSPYWQQAVYSAAVIEGLTRAMPRHIRPESGLTYLAGLLHNFGYLVLAHVFPPHFSLICRHQEVNPHVAHSTVEHHLLGITREQIGSWLVRHWDMPEEIAIALRFQHDPNYDGPHASYANLVCLTNHLLRNNRDEHTLLSSLPDALFERLSLSREKANEVLARIRSAEAALRELAQQMHPQQTLHHPG